MKVKEIIDKYEELQDQKDDVINALNGVIKGCRKVDVKRGLETITRNFEGLSQRLDEVDREYPFSSETDKVIIKDLVKVYFELGRQQEHFKQEELEFEFPTYLK